MDSYFVLCFLSLFILVFGLVSNFVKERLFISEPIVSILFGMFLGENGIDLDVKHFATKYTLYTFAKVVLCIQTMTAAMSLPHGYVMRNIKSLVVLIFFVAMLKYIISFTIVYIFTGFDVKISFAIAACLTPTDPILSSSIVKSKFADENVPVRLRHLLSAESGLNDGIGLALLFFPFIFQGNILLNIKTYVFHILIYKCIFAAILGILIGYISRKALKYCYSNDLVGIESFLIYGIALTFFVLGLMEVLGISELIGIFFTGTLFAYDEWFVLETRESRLQEVTDTLFSSSFFVFFGANINFSKISLRYLISAILILLLRRIIPILLFYKLIPQIHNKKEALFIGWFGPIGVGALFYSLFIDRIHNTNTIDYVSVIVLTSTIAHGLTIPLIKLSYKHDRTFFHNNIPTRIYTVSNDSGI
ncbi:Na+ H+ antiporter [Spraguea lophii 42_110]|uniref:Na+ H+ antiporter n=1 Tax=Spraguea lophii (strain 42_110) TaxID=1358809 RepID=S7W9N1_SPRLO|nr:Na+ H+ antiporter [Spraguea lophii 42_110]